MNRNAIGIILILLGSFFLLDRLDIIPDFGFNIFSWPYFMFLIAIAFLVSGKPKPAAVFVLIGAFFSLQRYFHLDMRYMWPVVLIILGAYLLIKNKSTSDSGKSEGGSGKSSIDGDTFDESVIFSGSEKIISSKQLKGGKVTTIFGGAELDFREAVPADRAVIDVFVLFGGAEFRVPSNWNVVFETTPIFGGASDERAKDVVKDGPTLRIKGTVIFGGCGVNA